jgi:8-oxo-dGTP pyrophosphatase MutT (NUDIX family)
VFPGGKVDAADRNEVMREVSSGAEGLADDEIAFRACAIRETFEETGVLLAYAGDGEMVGADDKLAHSQKHLNAGDFGFIDLIDSLGVKLAMDALVPFSRWVAPEIAPKRFDTMFYLTHQPADQMPVHDGYESTASEWVKPGDMIAQWERGEENHADDREARIWPLADAPVRCRLSGLGRKSETGVCKGRAGVILVIPGPPSGGTRNHLEVIDCIQSDSGLSLREPRNDGVS